MPPSIELKRANRNALSAFAFTVAENYLNELHMHQQKAGLPLAWRGLIKELRSRCPGFTDIEYGIALNRAFIGSPEPTSFPDPNQ